MQGVDVLRLGRDVIIEGSRTLMSGCADTTGNSLAMKSRVFEISAHRTHMPHRQGVTPSRRLPTIYADTYEY